MGTRQQRDALNRLAKVGPRAVATADAQSEIGMLSVSSVAEMIGVSKGELREVVQRPEFLARIRFKKPDADGRPARNLRIPRELVEDLRAAARIREASVAHVDEPTPNEPGEPGEPVREEEPKAQPKSIGQEMSLAIVYERLLSEKDARISDMRAEIEHLRSVLEREQNSHTRLQALLSLQAPSTAAQPEAQPAAAEPDSDIIEPVAFSSDASSAKTEPDTTDNTQDREPAAEIASSIPEVVMPAAVKPASRRPFWKLWG